MRTLSLPFCLALLFGLAPALAAERTLPYAELHKTFARVAALNGPRFVTGVASVRASDDSVPTDQIRIVIQAAAGAQTVPVAADGRIEFPLREDLLEENPPVSINVAEGKLSVSVTTRIAAPPAERFRYGLMVEMLEEIDAVVARQGMLARMMAPDFDGLLIVYAPGTQAHALVESAPGSERFAADADGHIVIPDRKDWRGENPFVQLSALPLQISLLPD